MATGEEIKKEVTTNTTEDSKAATEPKTYSEKIQSVPPVHSQDEIYRYVDLGLGRGLDATDSTPWLNKSSFQVRRVTYDNILGTEEGGAVQSYEREISSVHTQQTKIKSSLLVPKSPLTIGTDAELSRSVSASRRAIGRKVINRTISFRDNFDDVPFNNEELFVDVATSNRQNLWTFEQRLAAWILDKLKHQWRQQGTALERVDESTCDMTPLKLPSESESRHCPLMDLLYIIQHGRSNDLKLIANGCKEFIANFRVTHYVNAIELGAAEYRVFTEDEYQSAISLAGSFGIEKLANLVVRQDFSTKRKQRASDLKRIGIINKDERVDRGSYGEAVVNVTIKPITTLIKSDFLHEAMETAVVKFVESQSDRSDGPFLISCGMSTGVLYYLSVDPNTYAVSATQSMSSASPFYIIPNDGAPKTNEFFISYYKEGDSRKDNGRRRYSVLSDKSPDSNIALYLDAPLNIFGNNGGPLYVSDTVSGETSRFVLNSRILYGKHALPVPLSSWTSGSDAFYINCSRRRYRRDGYLALRRRRAGWHGYPQETFVTACLANAEYHDNRDVFMLFQLIPSYLLEAEEKRGDRETFEIVQRQTEIDKSIATSAL